MPIRLADRVSRIAPSPTIAVMTEAKRLAAEGIDVVDLGPGEPDFPTPPPIAEAGIAAIKDGFTRYTPVAGIPELRGAIAARYNERYGTEYSAANVIVGAGGKQTLYNACQALFQAGDEVIVPTPCWVSFPEMVRLADAEPVLVATDASDGFRPTLAAIRAAWTERTRGVILCSPSNPHGAIVREEELGGIVSSCAQRGATLLFDECYEHFVYERPHVSAAAFAAAAPDAIVVSGTFSKTFAMTGWRIGYLVGPAAIVTASANLQGHSTTNPASMGQKAALAALSAAGKATIAPMIDEFRERRDHLVAELGAIDGIRCPRPEGAFYVFADVRDLCRKKGVADSEALARRLIQEARVAVVPGSAFHQEGFVRLSFATSRERIDEALRRLRAWVDGVHPT